MIDGMIYIGQTLEERVEDRMGKNGAKYFTSPNIYAAIQKDRPENFQYTTLTFCQGIINANMFEDQYMELYHSKDPEIGYNIKSAGSHGKHHEATKVKISETLKAQMAQMTPEEIAAKAAPISTYWLGKERGPHTDEWKEENSTRMKDWHANNEHPMLGHHHTEEAKAKMSEANIGHKDTPETTAKRSLVRKTKTEKEQAVIAAYQNGDTINAIVKDLNIGQGTIYRILKRNNISLSNNFTRWTGKTHSPETKQKMSESRKAIWTKNSN
jgi:NUMOD3 motif